MQFIRNYWSLVLALALTALATGCATTKSEDLSERPWNAPMSWENGLPANMMQGR